MVSIEVAVGLFLFILSFTYALLDISIFFKKTTQEREQHHYLKYGVFYVGGYYQIVLKALLALLFVFVFLMVYNIILVGVFKPLISETVSASSSGDMTYEQIVAKAKEGYFALISAIAKLVFTTVFRIVDVRFALLLLFAFIPITIFFVVTTYHLTIARKHNMEKVDSPESARVANYHYLTIIIMSFIIVSIGFISFIGLKGCEKN
jgi:hypothetical protein